jgi:hypothetical protein
MEEIYSFISPRRVFPVATGFAAWKELPNWKLGCLAPVHFLDTTWHGVQPSATDARKATRVRSDCIQNPLSLSIDPFTRFGLNFVACPPWALCKTLRGLYVSECPLRRGATH